MGAEGQGRSPVQHHLRSCAQEEGQLRMQLEAPCTSIIMTSIIRKYVWSEQTSAVVLVCSAGA